MRAIKKVTVLALTVVFLLFATKEAANAQLKKTFLGMRAEVGMESGETYSAFQFREKIPWFRVIVRDSEINQQEVQAYFPLVANPTGREKLLVGLVALADDRDEGDAPLLGFRARTGVNAKVLASVCYKTGWGNVFLDKAMASETEGLVWYDRIRLEEVSIPLGDDDSSISLVARASYNFNPKVGFSGGVGLSYRSGDLELQARSDGFLARYNYGIGF